MKQLSNKFSNITKKIKQRKIHNHPLNRIKSSDAGSGPILLAKPPQFKILDNQLKN